MAVNYIRVNVEANLFSPATRAFGNVAIIGKAANTIADAALVITDPKERMGVAQLPKGIVSTAVVAGKLVEERMIYVAHKSDEDAAAAVAGTIAGYPPHISSLLKQVKINGESPTPAEIETVNGQEKFGDGPNGNGVNWPSSRSTRWSTASTVW
jgi:hypothetical protein